MMPERVLPTDDADLPPDRLNELAIWMGGNGDWYIATRRVGTKGIGEGVRLSTSGGTATRSPGVGPAMARLYDAIGKDGEE